MMHQHNKNPNTNSLCRKSVPKYKFRWISNRSYSLIRLHTCTPVKRECRGCSTKQKIKIWKMNKWINEWINQHDREKKKMFRVFFFFSSSSSSPSSSISAVCFVMYFDSLLGSRVTFTCKQLRYLDLKLGKGACYSPGGHFSVSSSDAFLSAPTCTSATSSREMERSGLLHGEHTRIWRSR